VPEFGGESIRLRALLLFEKGIDTEAMSDEQYAETMQMFNTWLEWKKKFYVNILKEFSLEIGLVSEE